MKIISQMPSIMADKEDYGQFICSKDHKFYQVKEEYSLLLNSFFIADN